MAEDRLNGLALMHVHRDVNVDRIKILDKFDTGNRRCWKNSHWRRFIFVESKRVVLVGLIFTRIDQNSGQNNTDVLNGLQVNMDYH